MEITSKLPHSLDVSVLSKYSKHEEDGTNFGVLLRTCEL